MEIINNISKTLKDDLRISSPKARFLLQILHSHLCISGEEIEVEEAIGEEA